MIVKETTEISHAASNDTNQDIEDRDKISNSNKQVVQAIKNGNIAEGESFASPIIDSVLLDPDEVWIINLC